jgi:tRNA pseudouridine55 synthase
MSQPAELPTSPAGFVFIDKPAGMTSHDVVAKVRRAIGLRRVGHAGTLDPMATGVLVVGVGRATRLLGLAASADKTYSATIRFGEATTTDDSAGEVCGGSSAAGVTLEQVAAAATGFTGDIMQRPSTVSAIKVDGKRAYARARAGEQVELEPRLVVVHEFAVQGANHPDACPDLLDVEVRVCCGTGTYVRALARDLGELLGTGGHLTRLRRIESSGIGIDECAVLEQFVAAPTVRPVAEVIGRWLPICQLDDASVARLRQGQSLPASLLSDESGTSVIESAEEPGQVAIAATNGEVVAIATVTVATIAPAIVLSPA